MLGPKWRKDGLIVELTRILGKHNKTESLFKYYILPNRFAALITLLPNDSH